MSTTSEASLEALTQLLMHPQSLVLSVSSSPIHTDIPVHLTNPLFPQIMQQQIFNYSLMQQLFNSLVAQSTMDTSTVSTPISSYTPDESSSSSSSSSSSTLMIGTSVDGKDLVVPNDDKEGWCRNKKYIEKVPNGFMCLVCKKVYGRYNSVSYHVTIYHRNPPIKCDIQGCDFTTREARYIHFHKYYRHGIPLPRSIDQGTRRCSFCKHVSKSPAMLDKHMKRHTEGGSNWSLSSRRRKSESMSESIEDTQEYRCRTISECPQPMDIIIEETKSRSFTL